MRGDALGKLVAVWLLLSSVSLAVGLLWLQPGFAPDQGGITAGKLAVLLGSVGAFGLLFTYLLARRWSQRLKRLEMFVEALPSAEGQLPEDGPPELQDLSRAMRASAERVRHIVEQASLESSRRETILAGMAEGVLAVDESLRVVFCNDAFAYAFNTRKPVSEGRPLYEVVREPALREILEFVVQSGAADKSRFRSSSAAGRWFEAHVLPLGDALKSGAIAVLHDITDIQHQEQVRKDFVADVSHELRTPLASIRGYAETLLDGGLEDAANSRKFVEIILNHAIRLNNIASDLLVLSELDSNAPTSVPDRVAVLDVVDSALHTVESGAAMRDIRLLRGRCEECSVMGYRFRLEQVLVNLLDNAVKFNRPGGEIAVECGFLGGDRVRITVSDTGIGIPSEDLKRIFERFYRVDKARSRPIGGTGLGLPIVKEVVERMGGNVTVESQLGRGTTFTISLQAA